MKMNMLSPLQGVREAKREIETERQRYMKRKEIDTEDAKRRDRGQKKGDAKMRVCVCE